MSFGIFLLLLLVTSLTQINGWNSTMSRVSSEDAKTKLYEEARIALTATSYAAKSGYNLLLGLPAQVSTTIVNSVCTRQLMDDRIEPAPRLQPKFEDIKLQLRTPCRTSSYALPQVRDLLDDPYFDAAKKIVIFATGWTTIVNSIAQDVMSKAYLCRDDTNYLALDFGDFLKTQYFWTALNAVRIGELLAQGLTLLADTLSLDQLHLLGHSLGAQIMGSAARHYHNLTGCLLPRVTGLDPAFGCFNEGKALQTLSAGDAKFVDVVHTAYGAAGQPARTGDVDFLVGGKFPIQNGCIDIFCSHERSWKYFAESVYPGNEWNFLAKRCTSLRDFLAGYCNGSDHPMGYAASQELRGQYVLRVNSKQPYGMNASECFLNFDSSCGKCN